MSHLKEEIIQLIERNRISSVEVADALGKSGVLSGLNAMTVGKHVVGEVEYIYGHSETNWPIHEQGEHVKENRILYVDAINCNDKALFGDIASKYFILYKRIKGLVVNGLMRDVHILKKEGYPLWCKGVTPLGCFNKEVEPSQEVLKIAQQQRDMLDGAIMVCDDSGCTLIAKDKITEHTKKRLEFIELQEDIWYFCLDTLKWSTYKTICQKAYLKDPNILPPVLQQRLKEYESVS